MFNRKLTNQLSFFNQCCEIHDPDISRWVNEGGAIITPTCKSPLRESSIATSLAAPNEQSARPWGSPKRRPQRTEPTVIEREMVAI